MGYYCTFGGEIHLSREACEHLLSTELAPNYPVKEFLQECSYENGALSVYFEGNGHYVDDFFNAAAALKDIDTVDELQYSGENSDDHGWYYIKPGKWVYVPDQQPPVPSDDDPSWRIVSLPQKQGC